MEDRARSRIFKHLRICDSDSDNREMANTIITFFIKILIPDLGKLIKKYRFAQKKKYHCNLTAWDNTCNNLVTVDFTRT